MYQLYKLGTMLRDQAAPALRRCSRTRF
jgi:hypothetical protein